MNFLLYARQGSVTGQRLADYLGIERGREGPDERPDFMIRWGSRSTVPYVPDRNTINRLTALNGAAGRLAQMRTMAAAGVSVPRYGTDPYGMGRPLIARRDDGEQTFGGRDIRFIERQYDVPEADFYTEYIDKDREFRVHVIAGRIAKVAEKIPNDGDARDQVVWNYDNGFRFINPQAEVPDRVQLTAIAAVGAFGLDFGAVDVILEGRNPYVLEVNTAPALDRPNLEMYGDRLADLIALREYPGMDNVEWEEAA